MKATLYFLASVIGSAVMLFTGARSSATGVDFRRVSPDEAEALIRSNAGNSSFVILDIRTPGEYRDGHIPKAMLLDSYSPAFRENLAALDRNKAYFIYCRSASRTGRATAMMQELGFTKVFELRGGVRAWISSGRALHVQ